MEITIGRVPLVADRLNHYRFDAEVQTVKQAKLIMGNDPSIPFIQRDWGGFEMLMRVSDLADCLMNRRPEEGRGEEYLTALMVCHEVLRGSEDDTAEDARAAFVAAAHEVGLSVIPDDDTEFDF